MSKLLAPNGKPSNLKIFKDGENIEDKKKKLKLEILKLTSKAFKQFSGSPNQKKTIEEISKLREQLDKIDGKFEIGGSIENNSCEYTIGGL